ncbi:MAG TPA: hypothetical protein VFE13_03470 [Caulobacteraceae bacterium]|nr:hypothetical protein [Caulobacteraceae bacterium]
MIPKLDPEALERHETLEALPAMLTMLRRLVTRSFGPDDPESDELKRLLEACVVGAHRLRLREQLRAKEALQQR